MTNGKVWTVAEPAPLLQFLLQKLVGKGRNKVKGLLTHRLVTVNGRVVTRYDYTLEPGQTVTVLHVAGDVNTVMHGVRILFEDEDLLVIDKPPRLLSIATDEERERTAYHVATDYVRRLDPESRVFIVHRLDKDTSGVMMFAKREEVKQKLQEAWKELVLERLYVVVVEGRVSPPEGTIRTWLKESRAQTMYVSASGDGQLAITHYKVLQEGPNFSLLEVRLETGRKNQIRVHMQSLGHSVVGDRRYGSKKRGLGRMGLHARVLAFHHPTTNELLRFETPIPVSFRKLLTAGTKTSTGRKP